MNKKLKPELKAQSIFTKIVTFLATSAYLGFIPIAPGTFGSLLAVPIFFLIDSSVIYYITLSFITVLGILVSSYAEKVIFKTHDSPMIVIDETAGCMLSMIAINKNEDSIIYIIIAFGLFRLFDIAKPIPINHLQKLKGGMGIMADDIMAAIYTITFLYLIKYIDKLIYF